MDLLSDDGRLHQSGPNFLSLLLTDQLCRLEPRHGPFFQLPPQIFNWIEIRMICRLWRWPCVSFFKDSFHSFCSMSKCIIIILEKKYFIRKRPLNWSVQNVNKHFLNMSWQSSPSCLRLTCSSRVINDCGKFHVFVKQSSSWISLERPPASSLCPMQIRLSFLTTTFIQSSTVKDCFSTAHRFFLFFFLWRCSWWRLFSFSVRKPHFLEALSYSLVTDVYTGSSHLFCSTFSVFKTSVFKISVLTLWCLSWFDEPACLCQPSPRRLHLLQILDIADCAMLRDDVRRLIILSFIFDGHLSPWFMPGQRLSKVRSLSCFRAD